MPDFRWKLKNDGSAVRANSTTLVFLLEKRRRCTPFRQALPPGVPLPVHVVSILCADPCRTTFADQSDTALQQVVAADIPTLITEVPLELSLCRRDITEGPSTVRAQRIFALMWLPQIRRKFANK